MRHVLTRSIVMVAFAGFANSSFADSETQSLMETDMIYKGEIISMDKGQIVLGPFVVEEFVTEVKLNGLDVPFSFAGRCANDQKIGDRVRIVMADGEPHMFFLSDEVTERSPDLFTIKDCSLIETKDT